MKQSRNNPPDPGLQAGPKNEDGPVFPNGQLYEILIKGQLSSLWADWFDGMTIEYLDCGEMRLSGKIVDQSAMMGILNKLVRLNLTLLSINEIKGTEEKK